MRLFKCTHCGQLLYFENYRCEQCGYPLGFVAEKLQLVPLNAQEDNSFRIYQEGSDRYTYCANHQYDVCNWLVAEASDSDYCEACTLNRTIPNLSQPEYLLQWKTIETAKHRLVYALLRMQLPLVSKILNPEAGLSFDFLADEGEQKKVFTGHANGLITLNIAEADDIEREMTRRSMAEPYRTVLGHFRHEVGHYYWDVLIEGTDWLEPFRQLFGNEQEDYSEALKRHYEQGAPPDWREHFISAYASTHPWEDWAETWAHYLHIVDTLETAYAFGLSVQPAVAQTSSGLQAAVRVDPYQLQNFETLMSLWLPLSFAMNSLNRSMGHPDLYPFVILPKVVEKLSFIHRVCYQARHSY